MRVRAFVAGLVGFSVGMPLHAQLSRDFNDSWFWGFKTGVATVTPTGGSAETAFTYGAEWVITRSIGGLYVSLDEARVSALSAVFDAQAPGGVRPVAVDKLRRIGVAALAFPARYGQLRPYAGLGLSISLVGDAAPVPTEEDETIEEGVFQRVDERRSQASVLGMAGIQVQFGRTAVFTQASVIPVGSRFLLGGNPLAFFEAGVRYNFGPAREGLR